MFTGIISDVGEVTEITQQGERSRLMLASAYDPGSIALGASIAISGVCLTVVGVARHSGSATFDVGAETLAVTTLGACTRAQSTWSARCEWATNWAAISSADMSTASRKSFASRLRRHGAFPISCPLSARQIHRDQGLGRAGRDLADGQCRRGRGVRGPADPAHACGHRLGRAEDGDRVNIEVDQMARYAARLIETGREQEQGNNRGIYCA